MRFPAEKRQPLTRLQGSFDCGFAPASRSKILAQDDNESNHVAKKD